MKSVYRKYNVAFYNTAPVSLSQLTRRKAISNLKRHQENRTRLQEDLNSNTQHPYHGLGIIKHDPNNEG